MLDAITQWLRDGSEDAAADLVAMCEIDFPYVDTCFEVSGDRCYDLFDVTVAAPRKVHKQIEQCPQVGEQIESAIRGQAEANGMYVRDIRWVPRTDTPTTEKDRELDLILATFDAEQVMRFWRKALLRKTSDPDGAVTAARSMLESVCKYVLTSERVSFDPTLNLPSLFHAALEAIRLSPRQQTDRTLRQVMGNCQSIVSGLAAIRNDIGDAHGRTDGEVIAESVQAEFVVNLSASVALLVLGQYAKSCGEAVSTSD